MIRPVTGRYVRVRWDDAVIPQEQTAEIAVRSAALFAERGFGIWGARLRTAMPERGRLAGFGGFWYFRDPPELELLFGVAETLWGGGLASKGHADKVRVRLEFSAL